MPMPPPRSDPPRAASACSHAPVRTFRTADEQSLHQSGRTGGVPPPPPPPSVGECSPSAHVATARPLTTPQSMSLSSPAARRTPSSSAPAPPRDVPATERMETSPARRRRSSSTRPGAAESYASASLARAARTTGLNRLMASVTSGIRSSVSSVPAAAALSPSSMPSPPAADASRASSVCLLILSLFRTTGWNSDRTARAVLHQTPGRNIGSPSTPPPSPAGGAPAVDPYDSASSSDMTY
mmetsp:Transcript_37152/g.88927  ORF Transcript_37152/g.88927 Transcript_37152/m.88927 type:complete len:240 (-) Transcript_37152:237-956(-)